MKQFTYLLLLASMIILGSCSTTSNADQSEKRKSTQTDNSIDLTQRIKMLPGVIVRGDRGSAQITISGPNSFGGNTSPLFVLDGRQVPNYSDLYSMVNTADIKRVQVLKDPVETSFYGSRGANGVIKVTTDPQ